MESSAIAIIIPAYNDLRQLLKLFYSILYDTQLLLMIALLTIQLI